MNIAETIPYNWWERAGNNPWYDRETRKVVLPDALKEKRNVIMQYEEVKDYADLLTKMRDEVVKERERVYATMLALERGTHSQFRAYEPVLPTLAHALEFMVTMAKHKLAVMQFLLGFTERAVSVVKGEDHVG